MYFSDRSHKFNQSTLPAEDTAMAQGAEQGSLEVTVTSSWGRRGQAQQDGCGLAGQWVQASRGPLTVHLIPACPGPFSCYWIAETFRNRKGRCKHLFF